MSAGARTAGTTPPRVSIVVNNYNYGRFLREALDSALGQTYPSTEVVAVDDGSSDDSRAILAQYRGRVLLVLKENGGQASALNAGFARSTGDIVIFLDADDRLEPEAAARVAAAWRPGAAKVQYPLTIMDGEGRPAGGLVPPRALPGGDLRELIRRTGLYPSPPTTGNAFGRALLQRLLPIPEREWGPWADTYLIALSPFFGEVISLREPLGRFRVHGANNWAVRELSLARLREYLVCDETKARTLRAWAGQTGFAPPPDWLLTSLNHLQARMSSLRLDPAGHPYAKDRPGALALRGVSVALRDPTAPAGKRALAALWFMAVALLPRELARRAIAQSYIAEKRPSLVRALLRGRTREPVTT